MHRLMTTALWTFDQYEYLAAAQPQPAAESVAGDHAFAWQQFERDRVRPLADSELVDAPHALVAVRQLVERVRLSAAVDRRNRDAARTEIGDRVPSGAVPGEVLLRRQRGKNRDHD